MSRMAPVPIEKWRDPDLRDTLEHFVNTLGFVPTTLLTMQRVPAIAKAVVQLNKAVFDPAGHAARGRADRPRRALLGDARVARRQTRSVALTASGEGRCR